ncbi:hypothetical protein [Desulfogranum japonicum]|uniref:hypothetical protein n=1 Tax=Desulfogranum japonicum TaxID=231447 RepID=UPI00041BC41D|nr:hypothetical protein [Desulfogranum japonicum]
MKENTIFKQCPMCGTVWETRDTFIDDLSLEINGYGVDFQQLELGLFYFTHQAPGCGSTLTIYAKEFFDLYSGKKYEERRTGKKDCPSYCLQKEQLDRCEALCECAFNREIIHIIRERKLK